ncbi:efflux RND transporter permease subunit [Caldisalinibacter kiritimatiensis]|uniref:Membrane protein n=1 Tax=Caldisalinibacter kiritimatiensis TaxID=1304284 RepID=R1CNB3_9FIRM|nr:efflux RND transporter permease subunit [Caldisalinibacter kiritimatiensis]EOD00201.1 membrane protein [Caldisalinibacter kiritimatiensis]
MNAYVKLIKNNRKIFIVFFILLNIFAIAGVTKLKIKSDFDIFTPQNSEHKQILDEMNSTFNTSEQTIFLVEIDSQDISLNVIKQFRQIQNFLEGIDNIEFINGPAPEKIEMDDESINLNTTLTEENLDFLKEHYEGMGELSTLIQKNNKIYGLFTVFHGNSFGGNGLKQIENYLNNNQITHYITGDMYMQHKIIDYILMILCFLPPAAFLLIFIVFRTQMGNIKATFLSILPAGIAALWTMGTIGWIGKPVSIITVLAPIFTIVIGSADGLHFVSHVQDSCSEGKGRIRSIVETLKMVGVPMIITTVTSMAGFMSLLVMNTDAIKDLALFASLGILLAGVATWYVLPLILVGNINLNKPVSNGIFFTRKIKRLWGVASIVIVIILLVVAFIGIQNLSTEFNQLLIYRNHTKVYESFEKIMEVNDGSIPVYLYIKTEKDPLEPSYAHRFTKLEKDLVNSKYVKKAISTYDALSLVNAGLLELEHPTYPRNLKQVNYISSLIITEDNNPIAHLLDRERKSARIIVFPKDLENETLEIINKKIFEFNNKYKDLEIKATGAQYMMKELNDSMLTGQVKSILLAFSLVFVLLFISLKKIKPTIISLLPIAFTMLIIFGFMGFTGISLNLFTATIFSITIGVGIDYAVHFTSVWRSLKDIGYNSKIALEKAYAYTARPIMANALGLSIGLSALLFSPLRIHVYMSVLMWVSMLSGVFISLSFLPTILRRAR